MGFGVPFRYYIWFFLKGDRWSSAGPAFGATNFTCDMNQRWGTHQLCFVNRPWQNLVLPHKMVSRLTGLDTFLCGTCPTSSIPCQILSHLKQWHQALWVLMDLQVEWFLPGPLHNTQYHFIHSYIKQNVYVHCISNDTFLRAQRFQEGCVS